LWDNEFIVFNPFSGDTHLFDYFSGEVLKALEDSPSTCSGLVSLISNRFGIDANDELAGRIQELLSRLSDLNLIEPAQ